MPRKKPAVSAVHGIATRLKAFALAHYPSWDGFVKQLALNPSTADAWIDPVNPRVPDTVALLHLGRDTRVSLDWLLLGEGPELRLSTGKTPEETAVAVLRARLAQEFHLTAEEAEGALDRLYLLGSGGEANKELIELSLHGLRERFHQALILMRHYAFLVHLTTDLQRLISALEQTDPSLSAIARKRLEEILDLPLSSWKEEVAKIMKRRRLEAEEEGAAAISKKGKERRRSKAERPRRRRR